MNLIEIFNQVRDIPYKISLSLEEKEDKFGGSCVYKVEVLKNLFEENNLTCRYRVSSFLWSNLNLPKEVIQYEHDDNATHVWLEVFINSN
jgi:hypothetical protein